MPDDQAMSAHLTPLCHRRLQVCSKCNETKAPSEFYVSKYLSTGLHSQCKKCVRAGQERRVRCPPEKAALEKVCRCGTVSPVDSPMTKLQRSQKIVLGDIYIHPGPAVTGR